jgi:hypothetical protein
VAVAAVGVAAILGWWLFERGLDTGSAPALAASTPAGAIEPSAAVPSSALQATMTAARPASTAPGGPPSAPAEARAQGLDEVEVCGRGVLKFLPDRLEQGLEELTQLWTGAPARARWLAALQSHADAKSRAAALLLTNKDLADESAIEQVARLALASRDVTVYGWAISVCHGRNDRDPPGACRMLSYEEWATLDPSRAVPWLYLADDQARRGVDAGEAMFRASRAETMGSLFGALPGVVLAAEPPGATPLDRQAMVVDAIAMSAAISSRTPYPLRHCDATQLRDTNRRQVCEALAQTILSRADTLLDLTVAKGLGTRLGWAPERLQAIGDEAAALQMTSGGHLGAAQPMACASIQNLVDHTRDVARLGELAAMRESVRRSGKTLEQLSADGKAELDEAAQRFLRAASAPGS